MQFKVTLIESEEGVSVSCRALRGCFSQGRTRAEALENICDAIREWLDADEAEKAAFHVSEELVSV